MATSSPLLHARDLCATYGPVQALRGATVEVQAGEVVAILGPNGAGKSTLLRSLIGLMRQTTGDVTFHGESITALSPQARARRGLVLVPEGRGIFGPMTVLENLQLGAYLLSNLAEQQRRLEDVFRLFPTLRERTRQLAGSLSGGEQQMLAVGRALMIRPTLLMLDEPSLGLAPRVAAEIMEKLSELNLSGTTILLVEQKAPLALKMAQRAYVLANGRIVAHGAPDEVEASSTLSELYLAGAPASQ
jgi:branched-chain amino acid transport system ATP-binding protein